MKILFVFGRCLFGILGKNFICTTKVRLIKVIFEDLYLPSFVHFIVCELGFFK